MGQAVFCPVIEQLHIQSISQPTCVWMTRGSQTPVYPSLVALCNMHRALLLLPHGWGWVGVIASWLGWLIASSKRTHVVPLQRRGWHRGAILARTNVSQHKAPLRWSSTTLVNLWLTLDAQLCLFFKVHRLSARGEGAITMLNSCCWLRIFTITPHTCSLCYCNF